MKAVDYDYPELLPAPPASYDAFMTGCNFCCPGCQNYRIAIYGWNQNTGIEGYYKPEAWAKLGVDTLNSLPGKLMRAECLFFTGGEPTCSLPWIEKTVEEARKIDTEVKVNFDTNGFMTEESLERILNFTTSLTFDIKAFSDDAFRSLTGAFVEPVLRNTEYIIRNAPEKIYEIRILAIPGVHEGEIAPLSRFLSDINPEVPVNFLAFRPEFLMKDYQGATVSFLDWCISEAQINGLKNVSSSGMTGIPGSIIPLKTILKDYGCRNYNDRLCGSCSLLDNCSLRYHSHR